VARNVFRDVQEMFDTFQLAFVKLINCHLQHLGVSVKDDMVLQQLLSEESLFSVMQGKLASDHLFQNYLIENMKLNVPVACHVSTCPGAHETTACSDNTSTPNRANANITVDGDQNGSASQCAVSPMLQYHYVPILVTLKNYLEQPDVWASVQQPHVCDGMLHDFTDGAVWEQSVYADRTNFIRIHLYSDELEPCNPIGSRRTVHKLSAFYFLVGNIPTQFWSSLTNIHMALLCKYNVVKKVGYKKILEPLLADIKTLETEGLVVNIDNVSHRVFGTVVTFAGDNLTSHALGGFKMSFSSGRVCRYCMATKLSLRSIHCESQCILRTSEGHNYHLRAVESDPHLSAVYGVTGPSPFSSLSFFNPVTFFPPDILHDVLEGLVSINVAIVLKHLIRKKMLTVKGFNDRLSKFKFGKADALDKFGPLPLDFVTKDKSVCGKAVENWTMFRLLSLVVGDVVPFDDEFWHMHLLCREICEMILAPVVDSSWLPHLDTIISHHHKLLAKISPSSFTPKIHFVTHYPRLIMEYGPLRQHQLGSTHSTDAAGTYKKCAKHGRN
jgi:hypothetical protein